MSRMKYLLRKLHLSGVQCGGGATSDHHRRRRPPPPPPPPPPPVEVSPPLAAVASVATGSVFREKERETITRFEEEYQVQLAMVISQSDPDGLEDPDLVQIKAAKQISLGGGGGIGGDMTAKEMEMLSLRYRNYNVVDYDEELLDGFYDLYNYPTPETIVHGQLPSLFELKTLQISQSTDVEVVLVDRLIDPTLQKLEKEAQDIFSRCKLDCTMLVQGIAKLVADAMGGTVQNAEEMQQRWDQKRCELCVCLKNVVIPLGSISIGLSRHRALLFKVLADRINLPCKLVRGSYYTGTDDGAVNFVKVDSFGEYMVDLMGAPGTLIPTEMPATFFQLHDNAFQSVVRNIHQDEQNTHRQDVQIKDTSSFLVTDTMDPPCAEKLQVMLSQNSALPDNLIPDPSLDISSEFELKSNLLLDGSSSSKVGGNSPLKQERLGSVMDDVLEVEIPWENLRFGERIGLGSYGEVYRADWNGTEVAVKKFLDQDLSGDSLEQFRYEVNIMSRLRHPNVVLFMGAVTRPPNLSILTEFLPRGTLYRLLHRPSVSLDEKMRIKMALDVARGMNYLHVSHPPVVHRDLKSSNLLVDKNWVVKVSDFGLSRLKHNTFLSSKSTAGTPEWMAPEVLRNEPSNEKCDVYSFGVILWELATMRKPWSGLNSMQVVGAVGFQNKRLEIPTELHPLVAEIISSCWDNDPCNRPSFAQLMASLKQLKNLVI
ncbi:protein kinase superfamily protein [Carex rostrata]